MNTETQNTINELAKEMNVTSSDVLCLAQSVANSLQEDKAVETFLAADIETRREMVEAYVIHAVKKFEKFQNKYLTNPEARRAFCLKIASMF
jgi:hypothetical protein